jgi:prolyl-tRNA synthetase
VNKEIVSEQSSCPKCLNVDLVEKKAIEVGNIFKLMTRFSDAFKFKFKDASGKDQPVIMGCYGIGPSRLMGTIAEIFHDDKGIVWPEAIAPFRVHLVSLGADEEVQKVANQLYTDLQAKNIEVLFDDREKASAGEKLSDADLIGIPYRLVVSKKTIAEKSVEFKKRSEAGARLVPIAQVMSQVI